MTTVYSLADTLPKDAGGAKMLGWVDVSTSQLDLSLTAGIGSKTTGSKIVSALWTGNGLAGCKVEPTGGVGTLNMLHFASNASVTAAQNGIHQRGDDRGQAYVSSLSATTCAFVATSRDTIDTASGIVLKIVAAACGAIPGAQVRVLNGAASLTHISFSQNSETVIVDLSPGACYSSLIVEKVNTTQPVYITSIRRNYGQ